MTRQEVSDGEGEEVQAEPTKQAIVTSEKDALRPRCRSFHKGETMTAAIVTLAHEASPI